MQGLEAQSCASTNMTQADYTARSYKTWVILVRRTLSRVVTTSRSRQTKNGGGGLLEHIDRRDVVNGKQSGAIHRHSNYGDSYCWRSGLEDDLAGALQRPLISIQWLLAGSVRFRRTSQDSNVVGDEAGGQPHTLH